MRKRFLTTITTHKPSRLAALTRSIGCKKQAHARTVLWLRLAVFIRQALQHYASGNVPNANWNRDNRQANLDSNNPENSDPNIGVRGAVRDYVFTDFNQPPSILPISASLLCVWKILVSLAILSSRKRRSFKTAISK